MAPAAWVRRLVTLCDQAPATPFDVVQRVMEKEFGQSVGEMFERFDVDPLGSASIAQVLFIIVKVSFGFYNIFVLNMCFLLKLGSPSKIEG